MRVSLVSLCLVVGAAGFGLTDNRPRGLLQPANVCAPLEARGVCMRLFAPPPFLVSLFCARIEYATGRLRAVAGACDPEDARHGKRCARTSAFYSWQRRSERVSLVHPGPRACCCSRRCLHQLTFVASALSQFWSSGWVFFRK